MPNKDEKDKGVIFRNLNGNPHTPINTATGEVLLPKDGRTWDGSDGSPSGDTGSYKDAVKKAYGTRESIPDSDKIIPPATPISLTTSPKSGIIDIESAKSFDEYKTALKTKYGITISDEIAKLDLESVKKSTAGLIKIFDEFPAAAESFKYIDIYTKDPKALMAANLDGGLKFNPKFYTNAKDINREVWSLNAHEDTPKNSTVNSIGAHEAGHLLVAHIIKNSYSETQKMDAWNKDIENKAILAEAFTAIEKSKGRKLTGAERDAHKTKISRDAHKTREIIAEAVCDVHNNGTKAAVLSKEIYKILKRKVK
jgi:hypothetical protein